MDNEVVDVEVPELTEEQLRNITWHLNDEMWSKMGEDYDGEIYFEYRSIGVATVIEFLGVAIWSSENEGHNVTSESIVDSANELLNKVKNLKRFAYMDEPQGG